MRRTFIVSTVAAALLTSVPLPTPSAAAPSPGTAATTPAATDQEMLDMDAIAEQAARLKAETEAALKEFETKQKALETITGNVQGAKQTVEDMLQLLRQATERLGPNSAYMQTLKAHEAAVRNLAAEASASPNPADHPYGTQLSEQASVIGSLQTEARDLAAKLTAEVDLLERSKSQIGYAYAVRKTEEFIKVARAYLDSAKGLLAGTSNLARKAEELARPTVPSQ